MVQALFKAKSHRYEPKDDKKYYYYYLSGCTGYKRGDSEKSGKYSYYVSQVLPSGEMLITRKSNTRNANVIFTIKLKKKQAPEDIAKFKEALE